MKKLFFAVMMMVFSASVFAQQTCSQMEAQNE